MVAIVEVVDPGKHKKYFRMSKRARPSGPGSVGYAYQPVK